MIICLNSICLDIVICMSIFLPSEFPEMWKSCSFVLFWTVFNYLDKKLNKYSLGGL